MTQAGQDATELLQKRGDVEKQIEALEKEVAQLGEEVENTVRQIGNIVHASKRKKKKNSTRTLLQPIGQQWHRQTLGRVQTKAAPPPRTTLHD